jgi:serine/threonine protein kinase
MVKSITRRKVAKNLKTRKHRRSAKANKLPKIKYIQLGGEGSKQCDYEKPLGAGGYGIAYKCMLDDKPEAVLKTVKDLSDASEISEEQKQYINATVEREKQILSTLPQHDNIVRYISDEVMTEKGFEKIEKSHYYLEFCDGGDLTTFNKNNTVDITDVYKQVFAGLKHLYENYIIHSDIKEDNILVSIVDRKPIYKIADFGLSVDIKSLPKDINGNVNQLSLFINATPLYRPNFLKYSTHFRDLYALFCMLHFLKTGKDFNTIKSNQNSKSAPSLKITEELKKIIPEISDFISKIISLQDSLLHKHLYNDPTSGKKIISYTSQDGYEPVPTYAKTPTTEYTINVEKDHSYYTEIYK